ncbi:hypothetical protein QL285_075020 [Trifolium repens]|nr:hypothetical protein QL285_075020 [Trifolium repens]
MHIISNQLVSRELKQVLENKQVHGTLIVIRKKMVIPFGNIWLNILTWLRYLKVEHLSHGHQLHHSPLCLPNFALQSNHLWFLYEGVKFGSSEFITHFAVILPITVYHALDNKQQTVI